MKKFIQLLLIHVLIFSSAAVFANKNNFQFQISEYHTQRQSGQTLAVYVRYALKDSVESSQYPDYRNLRAVVASYLEPSTKLPIDTYWEIIAEKMAQDLMSQYPLAGISIQLLVYPSERADAFEPGFHGPIYTVGDVIPLNQVVIPADRLDTNSKK